MNSNLVFVCEANVCRSPFMAFTFAEELRRAGDRRAWQISSSGVDVVEGREICTEVRALIGNTAEGSDFADEHRTAALAKIRMEEQSLIVVATRVERSVIAKGAPELRSRLFTLREAIALGAADDVDEPSVGPRTARATLESYSALLNSRRGLIATPRRFMVPLSRESGDAWDTPDRHRDRRGRHRAMLAKLRDDVQLLHAQVRTFLDSPTSGRSLDEESSR